MKVLADTSVWSPALRRQTSGDDGHVVQGSSVDFLLCAIAVRHRLAILTVDRAFAGYLRHLPIRLHEPRQF